MLSEKQTVLMFKAVRYGATYEVVAHSLDDFIAVIQAQSKRIDDLEAAARSVVNSEYDHHSDEQSACVDCDALEKLGDVLVNVVHYRPLATVNGGAK